MKQSSSKKSALPAFIGIYSPERSKSFSSGTAAEQLRAANPNGQEKSPAASLATKSKDDGPFSGGMARTISVYTATGASNGAGGQAPSPKAPVSHGGKQRASVGEVPVTSERSALSPSASACNEFSLRGILSGGAGAGGSSAAPSNHREAWASGGRPGQQQQQPSPQGETSSTYASGGSPAVGEGNAGGGAGSWQQDGGGGGAGSWQQDGGGTREDGGGGGSITGSVGARGDKRAQGDAGDRRKSAGHMEAGGGDLPRLGVRFPKQQLLQAAQQQHSPSASPMRQRGPELASRASSFSSSSPAAAAAAAAAAGGGGGGGTPGKGPPGGAHLYRVKWLDFGLTPEQALVKGAAERVARSALAKHAAKADETRSFPREAVAAAGKEGFGGVAVPTSHGGMGLSANDAALVFEALGMGDTSVAGYLTLHNMVAWLVAQHATPAMQQQILRNLASTALLAAYAASEPASGSDPAATATTATPCPGGYSLSGSKVFVAGAGVADVFLVLARTGEAPTKGLSLFLVNRTAPGLSVGRPEKSLGWRCVSLAPLSLQSCVVRGDALLGREGQGLELLNAALDLQRVWLSAVSVGGAQLGLDYTVSQGRERKQGAKAIADLQAFQFRLVELHSELQASRLMVRSAAQQLDARAPTRSQAAATAKQFATDAAASVSGQLCSLLGGAGMVGEHPLERICRDLRAHTVVGGANEQLLGRMYGEMMQRGQAAGGGLLP